MRVVLLFTVAFGGCATQSVLEHEAMQHEARAEYLSEHGKPMEAEAEHQAAVSDWAAAQRKIEYRNDNVPKEFP